MEPISLDVCKLAYILFNACMKKWNISYAKMGELIGKYELLSYVNDFEDCLNAQSERACVKELEDYIKSCGGTIECGEE